jgi:hypothetical protein
MLWAHLSSAIVKRARLGGVDAYCMTFYGNAVDGNSYFCSIKANKLSTVKKCLNEVLKYGGPFSPNDLYPVRAIVIPLSNSY